MGENEEDCEEDYIAKYGTPSRDPTALRLRRILLRGTPKRDRVYGEFASGENLNVTLETLSWTSAGTCGSSSASAAAEADGG